MTPRTTDDVSLRFLSYCAASEDFDLLVDGIVRPEYLSPDGRAIAEWVLEIRYGMGSWPPNLQSLYEQFPSCKWPKITRDATALDPRLPAGLIFQAMKATYIGEMMESSARLQELDFISNQDEVLEITSYQRHLLGELAVLSKPVRAPVRFGADPTAMMESVLGLDLPETLQNFQHPDLRIHNMVTPLEYGLNVFFARPKNLKSILLQDAAIHHCITRGYRGVLADQENSKNVLARRIACSVGGLDADEVKNLRRKFAERQTLTKLDRERLTFLEDAIFEIYESSNLLLIGKEEIDRETGKIVIDDVLDAAADWGADILFIEQLHKYSESGLRRNASEWAAVRSVVSRVADAQYATFGTTQEKKEDKKRSDKSRYKIRIPDEQWVFGGDAVSQNCNFLAHVQKWELGANDFLLQLTPLLSRDGSSDPIYIRRSLYTHYEEIDHIRGEVMAREHLNQMKMEHELREQEAQRNVRGEDLPDARPTSTPSALPTKPKQRRALDAALDPTLIDKD